MTLDEPQLQWRGLLALPALCPCAIASGGAGVEARYSLYLVFERATRALDCPRDAGVVASLLDDDVTSTK